MASEVTKVEFKGLEARVSTLEGEVEGEKLVTRHILEQTRRNGDDLAALRSRLDRMDQRFDGLERKFDGLKNDMPKIVGEAMREVLRESGKKKR